LLGLWRKRKSVLFVRPDYHCTFFYRSELRKIGWRADIYVPWGYPNQLLYSQEDLKRPFKWGPFKYSPGNFANLFLASAWYLLNGWRYEFHVYYGKPPEWLNIYSRFSPNGTQDLSLRVAKIWGCKLVFLPSGCYEELSKREFSQLDNGAVCGNCGFWDRCNDLNVNYPHFGRVRKYFDITIGTGSTPTTELQTTHMKWKAIDLSLWKPGLLIPESHQIAKSPNLRILHSFSSNGRDFEGRNIKGSPFIRQAVEKLIDEGHQLELMHLTEVPSSEMRFYQAQADIVVEQLRYGWWGSTGVETMALGKPVICYLRPSWKEFFFKNFPEYDSLPIIEANVDTIYESLKLLIEDEGYRLRKGKESREFAEQHFNPAINTKNFENHLLSLR
jgi:glycosyltransferase involved in cell wall biosynthesis